MNSGNGIQNARDAAARTERSRDRDCVAGCRRGDEGAFRALVERYSPRIYTHLVRLTGDREEARDLTQETFVKAYRFLNQFDASRSFCNWLYAIATNTGLNALRSKRRRGVVFSLDDEGRPVREPSDPGRTAHDTVNLHDLRQHLAAAVANLPPKTAALVHLHYLEEMPIREAAGVIGMSEGAAKTALCRARRNLRELLVEEDLP